MRVWQNKDKAIKLINGDCLEVMDRLIETGIKVDMVLTDPPYGTTKCKWDIMIPFDEMWERLKSLRNDTTPIVLFGSEPFSSMLRMSNIKEYKYDWVWVKNTQTGISLSKIQPMRKTENLSVFYKKQTIYNPIKTETKSNTMKNHYSKGYGRGEVKTKSEHTGDMRLNREPFQLMINPSNVLEFNSISNRAKIKKHPTQKPVELMEYLIKTYTNEGDLVLDFTMGSGSTGVACKNTNRRFIGIELDEKYFDIAVERMCGMDD